VSGVGSEASEKQCVVMTKAARRHGADVIRYSLRGRNASAAAAARNSSASFTGRHRTRLIDDRHPSTSLAVSHRRRPEMTSQLLLSIAAILLFAVAGC